MPQTYYKIVESYKELPSSWDALVTHDVFLQSSFLKALEQSCPNNITPFYLAIFRGEILVGVAIIQRVEMYLDDIFRKTNDNQLKKTAKSLIAKIVRGNGLVVGNLMHTGQHGLFFNAEAISQEDYLTEVFKAINTVSKQIKETHNKTIRIIGFKDYFEEDLIHNSSELFEQKKLFKVQVQPNMVLFIDQEWKSIEAYVFSLKKKYKRRFRTARKKSDKIEKRELSLAQVEAASERLFLLYKNVSDNAGVNSFVLPKDHFLSLKTEMKDHFKVFGYFLEDELVGFYTLILNGSDLETYFLGYNKGYQSQFQMYLNMLYDMLSFAIENNFKAVVYARTAMEIKSAIGAKPKTMHIYTKHTNSFIANIALKFIVNTLNPIKKWEERHPFK